MCKYKFYLNYYFFDNYHWNKSIFRSIYVAVFFGIIFGHLVSGNVFKKLNSKEKTNFSAYLTYRGRHQVANDTGLVQMDDVMSPDKN